MFYYGWTSFRYMRSAPRDAMVVEATGRQWSWSFKYPSGRVTQELYLALDRPVKINLKSADVIHGFFIPAFRVKADAVPGRTTYLWFEPKLLGSFDIECTVICGVDHSYMLSKAHVVQEQAFKSWYFGPEEAAPPVAPATGPLAAPGPTPRVGGTPQRPRGLVLLEANGCTVCHSLDGSVTVGPTFAGRFGARDVVKRGAAEQAIVVDEPYLRRAIQQPSAEIVKGYPPTMPEMPLTEEELSAVIAYLRTLAPASSGT
jgi:cytochrome c oxidase subunit 2